jgi:hypothetical protein
MKVALPLALMIVAASTPAARAGELHIYEHNGSVTNWFYAGDQVRATYETPRPGLLQVGVRSGDVIFEGFDENGRITGSAYAFKKDCAPARYQVMGRQENGIIELVGPAPVRDPAGCSVLRYSLNSPHARLRFVYSATHH